MSTFHKHSHATSKYCSKKKNFTARFYGWGLTTSRLKPLRGGSFALSSQKFLVLTLLTLEE